MGVSWFIAGLICGAAGLEFVRECIDWRRTLKTQVYPTRVNVDLAQPTSMHRSMSIPQLLDATLEPLAELQRIEREVCKRVGAKPDSNESDVVMHAVRDGHQWDAVLELEREHLNRPKPAFSNRVAKWV